VYNYFHSVCEDGGGAIFNLGTMSDIHDLRFWHHVDSAPTDQPAQCQNPKHHHPNHLESLKSPMLHLEFQISHINVKLPHEADTQLDFPAFQHKGIRKGEIYLQIYSV
jgi:hypothetical protein